MSHRHARWFKEAEAQKPLWKVSCNHPGCDYVVLTTDPGLTKVAHAGRHFGHPHNYTIVKAEGDRANG